MQTFVFDEKSVDQVFLLRPSSETIANFVKNVAISCKMEKQIPIIALIYIDKLLFRSKCALNA